MNTTADELAETIRRSGARRAAFLGLTKNVGKTTALVSTLDAFARMGIAAGTTSAGRDGEEFDAITGEAKPRFRIRAGQLVASASSTFESARIATTELVTLPFQTRFGPVQLRRAEGDGEMELIGPSTVSQMEETATRLEDLGARILLIDGALGRRAFACARIADGIVLSVGMAAGETLEGVLSVTRSAVELIRLRDAEPAAVTHAFAGAITELALRESPPVPGETLVADDFTAIFLTPGERRRLRERNIFLAVRRPARLLAITANPTAPLRPPVPARVLIEALRREFSEIPVFDVVADLRSDPEGIGDRT